MLVHRAARESWSRTPARIPEDRMRCNTVKQIGMIRGVARNFPPPRAGYF